MYYFSINQSNKEMTQFIEQTPKQNQFDIESHSAYIKINSLQFEANSAHIDSNSAKIVISSAKIETISPHMDINSAQLDD